MKKARTLLILGIWVAVLPYLGFPASWKTVLFTLTGIALIYYSYTLYQEHKIKEKRAQKARAFDNFSENI